MRPQVPDPFIPQELDRFGDREHPNILELEGLTGAVQAARNVLDGGGLDKHGVRKWARKSTEYHLDKMLGHMLQAGVDEECGEHHGANALTRLMMVLQLHLDELDSGPVLSLEALHRWHNQIGRAICEIEGRIEVDTGSNGQ